MTETLTPYQKARQYAAARALASGQKVIELSCGICASTSVYPSPDDPKTLVCAACGKDTPLHIAHRLRKQEIKAFIAKGIDIHLDRSTR